MIPYIVFEAKTPTLPADEKTMGELNFFIRVYKKSCYLLPREATRLSEVGAISCEGYDVITVR